MPKIDDGPTDGPPGRALQTARVKLSTDEAYELLESLKFWANDADAGDPDPGWHTHITDAEGRELTVSIRVGDESSSSRA